MELILKNGDVLHCKRRGVVSSIIKRVTRSEISHTALVWVVRGVPFVVDSQFDGTRVRTFDSWIKKYNYSFQVSRRTEPLDQRDFVRKMAPFINSKYGFFDLIRHLIFNFFGVWIGVKREDKNLICSEFVMRVFDVPDSYRMNPNDVYQWTLKNKEFILL